MTAGAKFKSFLSFIRNGWHFNPSFSFTFGEPCIQNQSVSAGNVYLYGVDIKVFFSPVQLIFTDMYIQISLKYQREKKSNVKSKKLQKPLKLNNIFLF